RLTRAPTGCSARVLRRAVSSDMSVANQSSPISTADRQVPLTHTEPPTPKLPAVLGALTKSRRPVPSRTPTSLMRPLNMTVLQFAQARAPKRHRWRTVTGGPGIAPGCSASGETCGLSPHSTDSHRVGKVYTEPWAAPLVPEHPRTVATSARGHLAPRWCSSGA